MTKVIEVGKGKITTANKFDEQHNSIKYVGLSAESSLAPSWKMLKWYKASHKTKKDQRKFVEQYIKELTGDIDNREELDRLAESDEDICLVSYGGEGIFSHRHIVHRIINYRRYGFDWKTTFNAIKELGWEAGCKVEK